MIATAGARLIRKSEKPSFEREAMIRFGGSPIRVAVPPMLDARASTMRKGTGSRSSSSAMSRVTGAKSSTVVTLSNRAENTAVKTRKITMMGKGRPLASFASRTADHSKAPLRPKMLTMIIMEMSRKMTL